MNELSLEEIVARRESGQSWGKLAAELGTSSRRVRRFVASNPEAPDGLLDPLPKSSLTYEELTSMVGEGLTDEQIAARVGMKTGSLARLRLRWGVARGQTGISRKHKTPEELALVDRLLDEGMSFRSCSQVTGMEQKTIARHFPGRGFTREQTLEAQMMGRELSKIAA